MEYAVEFLVGILFLLSIPAGFFITRFRRRRRILKQYEIELRKENEC